MKKVIVIPARYASSKLPGKPLAKVAGREMILRVHENAKLAALSFGDVKVIAATEDDRVIDFCKNHGIDCVKTSETCETAIQRVFEAVGTLEQKPEFIINLHVDNPLCPPWVIADLLQTYELDNEIEAATACIQLKWEQLDELREIKKQTPTKGTTCVMDKDMDACWFSRAIIPFIKNEAELRQHSDYSPVYRHVGIFGYTYETLRKYLSLPKGAYESVESLEQLRFIENGIKVRMALVDYKGYANMKGIDSEEDLLKIEQMLKEFE